MALSKLNLGRDGDQFDQNFRAEEGGKGKSLSRSSKVGGGREDRFGISASSHSFAQEYMGGIATLSCFTTNGGKHTLSVSTSDFSATFFFEFSAHRVFLSHTLSFLIHICMELELL